MGRLNMFDGEEEESEGFFSGPPSVIQRLVFSTNRRQRINIEFDSLIDSNPLEADILHKVLKSYLKPEVYAGLLDCFIRDAQQDLMRYVNNTKLLESYRDTANEAKLAKEKTREGMVRLQENFRPSEESKPKKIIRRKKQTEE